MSTIKKIGKFIASRALYLALGVFLAAGATYVYATWDDARTGGSGQLSEVNWNELVTMIENKSSSVSAITVVSASTYNHVDAAKYCYDLLAAAEVAMDGDTLTIYTDWRLPAIEEATVFEGTITDSNRIWTATVYGTSGNEWISKQFNIGSWGANSYDTTLYVRCVR